MVPSPFDPADEPTPPKEQLETIWRRLIIAAFELNLMLRAAAMGGNNVPVDLAQRVDPITNTEYTEVIVNGVPRREELEDDPG